MQLERHVLCAHAAHSCGTLQYILVFGIGYALFSQIHRFCPNLLYTIILVYSVSIKLLTAGAKFLVLSLFYGEIVDFYPILWLIFHPQHELEPQFGGVLVVAARISDFYLLQISRWSDCYAQKV